MSPITSRKSFPSTELSTPGLPKTGSSNQSKSRAKSPGKQRAVSPPRSLSPTKKINQIISTVTTTIKHNMPSNTTATFKTFNEIEQETTTSPYFEHIGDRFSDADRTLLDMIAYKIENAISANDSVKFYVLLFIAAVFCIIFVFLWKHVSKGDSAHNYDLAGDFFMIVQVLISSGFDGSIVDQEERLVFICVAMIG